MRERVRYVSENVWIIVKCWNKQLRACRDVGSGIANSVGSYLGFIFFCSQIRQEQFQWVNCSWIGKRVWILLQKKINKSAGAVKQTAVEFKACLGCNQ